MRSDQEGSLLTGSVKGNSFKGMMLQTLGSRENLVRELNLKDRQGGAFQTSSSQRVNQIMVTGAPKADEKPLAMLDILLKRD